MKKLSFIKTALLSLTAVALLSSCLKDPRYVNFPASVATVEIPSATGVGPNGGLLQHIAYPVGLTTASTFNLGINFAGGGGAPGAITVKLSVDQTALTAYNTANGTSYTLLPAADYSSSLTVTIPAGQNFINLPISINSGLISPSAAYVLPLTITDGGGQQISNWKTVLLNFSVKNPYDGVYAVTGTMTAANPAQTGLYPNNVNLVTQGATSVAQYDIGIAKFAHTFMTGGSVSYYGEFAPQFNFDPSSNKVTAVTNFYGQPSPTRNRSAQLDPTTAVTVTGTPGNAGFAFTLSYNFYTGANLTSNFYETFTYTGVRN